MTYEIEFVDEDDALSGADNVHSSILCAPVRARALSRREAPAEDVHELGRLLGLVHHDL